MDAIEAMRAYTRRGYAEREGEMASRKKLDTIERAMAMASLDPIGAMKDLERERAIREAARIMGSARSMRKAASSRVNGMLGGRPRKVKP